VMLNACCVWCGVVCAHVWLWRCVCRCSSTPPTPLVQPPTTNHTHTHTQAQLLQHPDLFLVSASLEPGTELEYHALVNKHAKAAKQQQQHSQSQPNGGAAAMEEEKEGEAGQPGDEKEAAASLAGLDGALSRSLCCCGVCRGVGVGVGVCAFVFVFVFVFVDMKEALTHRR
jgi:hypothetical protein